MGGGVVGGVNDNIARILFNQLMWDGMLPRVSRAGVKDARE